MDKLIHFEKYMYYKLKKNENVSLEFFSENFWMTYV